MTAQAAMDNIRRWRERPDLFVREVFGVTPDPWQDDALQAFPHNQRMALKACKGPGKTAFESWIAWNFLCTRLNPKIAATSISGDNLRDNLWAEMSKWQTRSPFLKDQFEWTASRIYYKERQESWFMSARTWSRSASPEQQGETLAGLHEDSILFILDEVGGIPQAVMETAEAALANGGDSHLLIAGNCVRRSGPLYEAAVTNRRMWWVSEITGDPDNPKRSPRIDIEWAREQIAKAPRGREDPFVRVNILGEFPLQDIQALLSEEDVQAAMSRTLTHEEMRDKVSQFGRILGVDVAREGDDQSVIVPRQGILSLKPTKARGLDSIQGAGMVRKIAHDWRPDAVHVDGTGGFGSGWCDQLMEFPIHELTTVVPVQFSGKPSALRFYNKRTEMIWACAEWIKSGGVLYPDPDYMAELTTPTYSFIGDRIIIEPKDDIKRRLGRSPDLSDALALTFAYPAERQMGWDFPQLAEVLSAKAARDRDWDPLDETRDLPYSSSSSRDWDPLG